MQGSETTAAAVGATGAVRRDPFAMLPFCGYHMGDYLNHWLQFGRDIVNPPRIFGVNWFRKDAAGKYIWPGFGENMRVLKWVVERSKGKGYAIESPLGWMPRYSDLDWTGSNFTEAQFSELQSVDREEWYKEMSSHNDHFLRMYDRLPKEMIFTRELILSGLWRMKDVWKGATSEQ